MYSLDRIEDDIAVLIDENGDSIEIGLSRLPNDAQEGDMLKKTDNTFIKDVANTQRRKELIADKLKNLYLK